MVNYGSVCILDLAAANGVIHPVLVLGTENMLIDCGFPGQAQALKEALAEVGIGFSDLNKILLTHQDIDHVGCVNDILAENPGVEVLCHEEEAPYINWEKTPIKLAKREATIESATPEEREFFTNFKKGFEKCKTKIHQTFKDGDELFGNMKIIHTPGHTPGHVCMYLKNEKLLITGDGLNAKDGTLAGPNPVHTADMEMAVKSLEKLHGLDIDVICCYHGGIVDEAPVEQLKNL